MHPVLSYGQDNEKQKSGGTSYQSLFELRNMFRKFLFWSDPLNLDTGKGKNQQNAQYLKNKKRFLEEIKTIFHNFFEMLSLDKI